MGIIDILNSCYMNRELSWLSFNERCLDEAGNPDVPLAERLTFASIFQSNLDEFFMVRVGTLMIHENENDFIDNKTGMNCSQQVEKILERVKILEEKKSFIYEQLMGELEPKGIRIINFNKLSAIEAHLVEEYFDSNIAPFLSPMIVGKQQPFPFLDNKKLYGVVHLLSRMGKTKMGIVPCSSPVFSRLIEIPGRKGTFMLCEELILHFISKLYENYTVKEKSIIRITRNADLDSVDLDDEEDDYRNYMEHLIKKRRRLSAVRMELSRPINDSTKKQLAKLVGIENEHIINVGTPLDLSFVFLLQKWLKKENPDIHLFYKRRLPRNPQCFDMRKKLIPQIEEKDKLVAYPFHSMKAFLEMLHEAANDKNVVSIKMTLYRVAYKSKIIEALVEAAENGKEVVVVVELRARFDESNNIEMSRLLEDAGCQIVYGLGSFKVHSKLCLITKKTKNGFSYITQIGTGNYNEKTSELYTDLSLMTANQNIGSEVAKVFLALMKGETVAETEHLLVAPNCLQNKILKFIDDEIQKIKNGGSGYVGIKINSLTDKDIIDKLIEASQWGVKIQLIIRGICCLIPGIEGFTENISVVSIVGRYLEHSRIYRFGQGNDEKIYISSADFMTRNTIRRVEVAVPIYDEEARSKIKHIFDTCIIDDAKGRELKSSGKYEFRKINENPVNSQEYFFEEVYKCLM